MLDLIIRNGTLVDGTGAPASRSDVGIRDGRVIAVGQVDEPAQATIDAEGHVVAPGFVDIHTHFDAQVFWDPLLTPSSLHGVTTAIGGNCGFSVAPLVPESADYLLRMLSKVEGMPLDALQKGADWQWGSFGSYLSRLDGSLALNAGFLVGHSALRRAVMGERSVGEEATEEETRAMGNLLHRSLAEGGLGFSSSQAGPHFDGDGKPVPSRFAGRDELLSLAAVVRDYAGTTLEFNPLSGGLITDAQADLMAAMSIAADRPLNWNVLLADAANPETARANLRASRTAEKAGGAVFALTLPEALQLHLNFASGFTLETIPLWGDLLALPHDERRAALTRPEVRARLREGAEGAPQGFNGLLNLERLRIGDVYAEENAAARGRTVADVARQRGGDPFDVLLDIVVADDLRTELLPPTLGGTALEDWRFRREVWRDPAVVLGASDAGAHLDMLSTFTYSTRLLGTVTRELGLLSIEEAIHLLTGAPARLYGITDRGRLAPGAWADVVVFDPVTIEPGPVGTRFDLPGGAGRLYGEAIGIAHVIVNGTPILDHGAPTGNLPGTVLRSGRDTATVDVAAARRIT
jgi:N-acyl-D-aspartate/D-glutamate deacylase